LQVARADVDFHEAICSLSGIGRLHDIFRQHVGLLRTLLLIDEHLYPVVADISDEHCDIFRSIKSGDQVAAIATLESHLERSKERLVSYVGAGPLPSADLHSRLTEIGSTRGATTSR